MNDEEARRRMLPIPTLNDLRAEVDRLWSLVGDVEGGISANVAERIKHSIKRMQARLDDAERAQQTPQSELGEAEGPGETMTARRRTLRIEKGEQLVQELETGRSPTYGSPELQALICGADWATPEERERAQHLVARLERQRRKIQPNAGQ